MREAPRNGAAILAVMMLFAALGAAQAASDQTMRKPLWEVGLGVGVLGFPDYRGSKTSHVYPLPLPYFVYRGRYLQADRNGLHGLLLNRRIVNITLSADATTPVRSRNSVARRGMPDLRPTVALGPSLNVHLWRSENDHLRLDLRMPLRGALTVESSPHFIGWFFTPRLNVDWSDAAALAGWKIGFAAGPMFADRRYDEYFYGVAPRFATVNRPAYEAHGGYSGSQILTAVSKRFPRYWIGAFVQYDWLNGAAFGDSPLAQSKRYWAAGIGVAWMIGHSSTLVDVPDWRS